MKQKLTIKSIGIEIMRQKKLAFIDSTIKCDKNGNPHHLMLFVDVDTNIHYAHVNSLAWMETNATSIDELKELYK